MRSIFGVLSLILVLLLVGFLAKIQLRSLAGIKLPEVSESIPSAVVLPAPGASVAGNALSQSQLIQQQLKAATEAAMQRTRTLPDDNPETPQKN
jgi:hypothetical protein